MLDFINKNKYFIFINAVLAFVLVNMAMHKLSFSLDLSRDSQNSLSPSFMRIIDRLKQPVLIEAYITTDVPGELKSMIDPVIFSLELFARHGGDKIRLRIINPDDAESQAEAEKRGIQGIPIEQAKIDEISQKLGFFGIYLQMGDDKAVIDLVEDGRIIEDLEYRMLKELKRLMHKSKKSGIAFLQTEGTSEMRPWRSYNDQTKDNMYGFRMLLDKDMGSVEGTSASEPISADTSVLIITGMPELNDVQKFHIDQFLMRGGNIIFMLKAFDFQLAGADPRLARMGLATGGGFARIDKDKLEKLNQWLMPYGLSLNPEILLEPELGTPALDVERQYAVRVTNHAWGFYARETDTITANHPALKSLQQIIIPWYSGVDVRDALQPEVKFETIVRSSEAVISRQSTGLTLKELRGLAASKEERSGRTIPLIVYGKGKFKSAFTKETVPEKLKNIEFLQGQAGSSNSSVLLIGSPYLTSDILLQNDVNVTIYRINLAFLQNMIELFTGDTDLIEARSKIRRIDHMLDVGPILEFIFKWFHILIFPFFLGLYGVRRLMKRNRKQGAAA